MASQEWLVTGNDGTNPTNDFLGTIDNQPLTIRTNGAERVRVDPTGNVGVGTPAPQTPLHVLGRIASGAVPTAGGAITFFPPDGHAWFHIDNGPGGAQRPMGRLRISYGGSPGDNEVVSVLQNNCVGIGTARPDSKLHVNAGASSSPIKALTIEATSFTTPDNAQASYFLSVQQPSPSPPPRPQTGTTIDPPVQVTLGGAPLTHFFIRGDGNVGIGTSQPTEQLHVNGNARVDGNVGIGTDTSEFILDVNERIRLRGEGPANTAGLWLFQASKDQAFVGMANDSHVGLFGNNGASWGLVMDTANGNVGVGTGKSPVSKLHVDVAASQNPIGALSVDVESFVTAPNAQASYFLRVRDIGAVNLPPHFLIRGDGNVGIGDPSPSSRLSVKGDVTVSGDVFLAGADCAEHFDLRGAQSLEPGTVVIIDQDGAVCESREVYDKKVAGVVSGAGEFRHAIVLDRRPSEGPRVPVALLGKVYCKVDARCAPIGVGDFLTTSPTPGHAMKALDPTQTMGSVIGKALRPLEAGQGVIPILIALQ